MHYGFYTRSNGRGYKKKDRPGGRSFQNNHVISMNDNERRPAKFIPILDL